MGIFSRFRDIIHSNINAMLDKAEEPEKLIRLMIQEMEETLVELKADCARTMAQAARIAREHDMLAAAAGRWGEKAELAVDKGREDMAREALLEKRDLEARASVVAGELAAVEGLIEACREDIATLEEKLASAKERQRTLVARHLRATGRKRMREDVSRADSSEALQRFEAFEARIDRLEAEAELTGTAASRRRPAEDQSLDARFDRLAADEDVERELAQIKSRRAQ
ncbi:MAG: phage shock protein A (IM30), suppresses sigma54-dependent transcription [Solidesulfovibrio magneticus str. Maddingley MBC34]|uniref:Phage shock protein A (IM30), suppresses sigma54-dependent transcription n=1 Tax=Solidesulfovibrio magneticus str. Maddingley MBC34 TaxID=1206767 RepID=K6FMY4_9BACT|nr:MAG: phage shock protein A (IM30), suppresses sigma54-dependent transcription [Solidesulfovibrio magneticus str. Maddingley MBC34]